MIPLNISLSPPSLLSFSSPSLSLSKLRPPGEHARKTTLTQVNKNQQQNKLRRGGICRAVELQQDAPIAIAIGASMLNSLLFPDIADPSNDDDDDDVDAAISSTDARFAVMTIMSFIPYFNWLSWVFALMDTGKRRYAVYAIVYLAPYIRTNLSLSPEESWLPIASIVLCIIHIQLESSIRSGDFAGFNFFNEVAERVGFVRGNKDGQPRSVGKRHEKERSQNNMNLPSGQHQSREEIRKWRVPEKPSKDLEHVNEDGDLDDGSKP